MGAARRQRETEPFPVFSGLVEITNHDDGAIPCKHDDAGWDKTTITSS